MFPLARLTPGSTLAYGQLRMDEAEIVAFARMLDPQPMHLDAASPQAQLVGGLIGSGWQTVALSHRALLAAGLAEAGFTRLAGVPALRWPNPVRPGDEIRMEATVVACDDTTLDLHQMLTNQRGDTVMTLEGRYTRSGAARAPHPPLDHDDAAATPVRFMPFDALPPGTLFSFGEHRFEGEAIRHYRALYDPQGAETAGVWHVAAQWLKQNVDRYHAREAAGDALPRRGPGLGITDVCWPTPVRAGERLRYFSRVLSARASASRPGWGILTQRNYALNDENAPVVAFTSAVLLEGSPA